MSYDLKQIRYEAMIVRDDHAHRCRKYRHDPADGTMRVPAELVIELIDRVQEAEGARLKRAHEFDQKLKIPSAVPSALSKICEALAAGEKLSDVWPAGLDPDHLFDAEAIRIEYAMGPSGGGQRSRTLEEAINGSFDARASRRRIKYELEACLAGKSNVGRRATNKLL